MKLVEGHSGSVVSCGCPVCCPLAGRVTFLEQRAWVRPAPQLTAGADLRHDLP